MRRIPIAFLIDTIDYKFGGTEAQLAMLLERIDRDKFRPYLCCLRDSPWLQANHDLCRIYVVGFRSFLSPRDYLSLWRFVKFLRRERVSILQSHFRDSNIVASVAGKLARVPTLIGTRRNIGYWHNRFELALLRLLNPLSSLFVVNAQIIRRHLVEVERVPAEKIVVIYNGVQLDRFTDDSGVERDRVRKDLGIGAATRVVTLVGNLRAVKGIDIFLRAAAEVVKKASETRFLVIGEGPERAALERLAAELGLGEHVKLLGTRADVPSVLAASDVGVLSSHSEGLSNAIIEYLAAGLPVVATNVGGNSELVKDGENGYLVPPGNPSALALALSQVLDQPEEMARFGANAARWSREAFDSDQCVTQTQSLYLQCAGGEQKRRNVSHK